MVSPEQIKPKTINLVFVVSLLSTRIKGVRTKTSWLGIRIMCLSEETCIPTDLFTEIAK